MGEKLQAFFESTTGIVTVIAVIVILLVLILISGKKSDKKLDIKAFTVSALMIAAAIILSNFKLFTMPQGGSITLLSSLPIVLVGYLYGTRRGVMAGFCVGLLSLIFGPYVIHPIQMLVDYPLAFGALGLSGLAKNSKNGLTKGYIIGIIGRYICAVFSGIVFFGAYAPEGFNAVTWSLWYNITYIAVEGLITLVIINIPAVRKAFANLQTQVSAQ